MVRESRKMSGENEQKWSRLFDGYTDLCVMAGLSRSTIAKMGKEEYMALEVVERICKGLSCQVQDVIEVRE